jgi:DNA polymerase III delta prime subunit
MKKKSTTITKDISIESIRSINKKLSLAATDSAKVLIIDDAHRLTVSAQNALLKTLEEPPKDTYIFLVTHMPEFLLDTIISRCFSIQFDLVEKRLLENMYAQSQYIDDAQGRPGFLKKIHDDEDFRAIVMYAREQLQGLFKKKLYERIALAQDLAKKDEYFITIFFTVWTYRIWYAAHGTQKYHLLHVADRIEDLLQKMQSTNVNKQLALEDLLINIV